MKKIINNISSDFQVYFNCHLVSHILSLVFKNLCFYFFHFIISIYFNQILYVYVCVSVCIKFDENDNAIAIRSLLIYRRKYFSLKKCNGVFAMFN